MFNTFILNENFTAGFDSILLTIISILSVIFGILVIISKNPVVSVLFLIGLFFSISLYLMAIGLSFIGLSYLLVYVGAVSILFLFILMLINVRVSELVTDNYNSIPLSIITICVFSTVFSNKSLFSNLTYKIWESPYPIEIFQDYMPNKVGIKQNIIYMLYSYDMEIISGNVRFGSSNSWDGSLTEMSHITSIGNVLYTRYPMLLLITSIILLLAMIGAIVITLKTPATDTN